MSGLRRRRGAGEVQSDLPERHLPWPRRNELLGILIPSAAPLMMRKFPINNYELKL